MGITKSLYKFQGQLVTLALVTIIIIMLILVYYVMQLKQDAVKGKKRGYVVFIDWLIKSVENTITSTMGPTFTWFTPYAIFLLLYIGIGNMMALLGFEAPLTSYTVTFMLGFVTFIGIYIAEITTHKWKFFLKYIKNPTELIAQFAPLISITFRIFGNLTAGSVIIFLFFLMTNTITSSVPVFGYVNILGGVFGWVLKLYFDVFDGLVQTYIFMLLTLSYIGLGTIANKRQTRVRKVKIQQFQDKDNVEDEDIIMVPSDIKYRSVINEGVDITRK